MAILAKKIQPSKAQAIEEAKKVLSEYKDFIFVEYIYQVVYIVVFTSPKF